MAVKFPFVSGFLCERVMTEKDDIPSAIRMVDLFYVPDGLPEGTGIQFWAFVMLKIVPVPEVKAKVSISIVNSKGERQSLPPPTPDGMIELSPFQGDRSVPGGITLILQFNVIPKNLGTCYVEVDVDGENAIRIPFTLRRSPSTPVKQ
jgi:hypothetical protein